MKKTFLEPDAAERALASDRPRFLQQQEILILIPKGIRGMIDDVEKLVQHEGFQELFVDLNRPGKDRLRERIAIYFWSHADLRGHLSKICFPHNPQMQIAFLTVIL